jgi:TIR domain
MRAPPNEKPKAFRPISTGEREVVFVKPYPGLVTRLPRIGKREEMSTLQARSTNSAAHQEIYDVFLSHYSGDKLLVESIAARLVDEQGLRPFLDKWHLIPGEPWQEALEEALDRSRTCAVFLGPGGLGPWENEEMRAALDERVRYKSFRVIPVLLPGAEPKDKKTLPRFLRRLTWVDFRGGLDDPDPFQRLIAGIRGVAPGRQSMQTTSAITPVRTAWRTLRRLRDVLSSVFAGEGISRVETWKIVLPAVLALLLSTPFIGAAIPKYKLQIKSPAFRKEGVYEAPAGTVLIKWGMTKEQWFRETDISDVSANLIISKSDGEVVARLQNQPGEALTSLKPGKYGVLIDAVAYQRNATISLQITTSGGATETATLSGTVIEPDGKPIQGAKVTIDEMPGMTPVETSTYGVFIIEEIPKPYGEGVRINVTKEGYLPKLHTEDVVLGETPPKVKLRRKK